MESFVALDADMFCVQETKAQEAQLSEFQTPGYRQYYCSAVKKGYSGTAVFTRHEPLSVSRGIGQAEYDGEGRCLTLEFEDFYLVNSYTPNAQHELKRLDFRLAYEDAMREYLVGLDKKKPVVLCGDLNVAHQEIDLKNPKSNRRNPGFSDEERAKFTKLLSAGFVDSFRHFNPNLEGAYTWWSYRFDARARNIGWRIDYFIVSERLIDRVVRPTIHTEIFGSDHCPVALELDGVSL